MQTFTARVDRQATSLLNISVWSNLAIIALLAVVNVVNFLRAGANGEPLIAMASPEIVLIVSLALGIWLVFGCYGTLATKKRLTGVYVSCTENGVEGISMPNPIIRGAGESFSLAYDQIEFVGAVEAPLTKRHKVPSLKLSDGAQTYLVPAPEELDHLIRMISERMTAC